MNKTLDLTTLGLSAGTYAITVKVRANGYKDSLASDEITYIIKIENLATPTISLDNDILSMTAGDNITETFAIFVDGVEMATVEIPKEEKYTVSGTWKFNKSIQNYGLKEVENVSFVSNDTQYNSIYGCFPQLNYDDTIVWHDPSIDGVGWISEAYRTITFDGAQTVSQGFYELLTAHAVQQDAPKVKYFIIGDTAYVYMEGMTWAEWITTDNNAGVFSLNGDTITDASGLIIVDENNNAIKGSDVISNSCYYLAESQLTPTEGLAYTLSDDGTYYTCTGIGTATDMNIVIASEINGIPVTSIGDKAFFQSNVMKLTFGRNISSIGSDALSACLNLLNFVVPEANKFYKSVKGILYSKDEKTLVKVGAGRSGSFVVPNGVITIDRGALAQSRITNVEIPDSVTSLGRAVFQNCDNLTSVSIPDSVEEIGVFLFAYCDNLNSVTIGQGIYSISESMFRDCIKLENISFNGTVEEWDALSKGNDWEYNIPATYVQCTNGRVYSDGTIVPDAPTEETYTVSGACTINENPYILDVQPLLIEVNFWNDSPIAGLTQYTGLEITDDTIFYCTSSGNKLEVYSVEDGWKFEIYRKIAFVETQTVSKEFYEWLTARTVKQEITFTIDGTTYYAVEGTTWGEWCGSDYNTGGFYVDLTGNKIWDYVGYVRTIDDVSVSPSDIIIGNDYSVVNMQGGGIPD